MWNGMKLTTMDVIKVPEIEEKERGVKINEEIMTRSVQIWRKKNHS